jgi:hypothetical protein
MSMRFLITACSSVLLAFDTAAAQAVVASRATNATTTNVAARPAAPAARTRVSYGDSARVGDGRVRTYVTTDRATGVPIEVGVAFTEKALENLPMDGAGHAGMTGMVNQWSLSIPATAKLPFKFLELNWNPKGHEPDGVYQDVPHFDFHFYTITPAERDAIMPSDPAFKDKANRVPAPEYVPQYALALGPPGAKPADVAVPMMGVHWIDVRSPELQGMMGKPEAFKPFTATFIVGSWDGRFHFWEPMITRAHLLEKKTATDAAVRDQLLPISVPAKYQAPGAYPTAYRITWDPSTREYRVALSKLVVRN